MSNDPALTPEQAAELLARGAELQDALTPAVKAMQRPETDEADRLRDELAAANRREARALDALHRMASALRSRNEDCERAAEWLAYGAAECVRLRGICAEISREWMDLICELLTRPLGAATQTRGPRRRRQ
jgi:hypothetical protein